MSLIRVGGFLPFLSRCSLPFAAGVAVFALACVAPARAATVDVGHTNLVKNSVFGVLEGQPRNLMLKDRVYFDEEIVTGTESATQITFADDTKLTMGPNARMVLDEMVYDPADPTASKMTMTMVQGVFSFVSGKMRSEAYTIQTPTTTIGVRGTAFSVLVRPNGTSAVTLQRGIVRVAAGGRMVGLMQPGRATVVRARPRGAPPAPPTPPAPPPADMAAEMAQMNTLVAEAAADAGVAPEVLDVPTEVSAPLGPEESAPEPTDGGAETAQTPGAAPEQADGGETQGETGPQPEAAADTGGDVGAGEFGGGEGGGFAGAEFDPITPSVVLPQEPLPDESIVTYKLSIASDAAAALYVYVNTSTGVAYGHYEGEVDSVYSVGVLTGTYAGGKVTGQMQIMPNNRVSGGTKLYYADDFEIDLNAGTGSFDLDAVISDQTVTADSTSLTWTAAVFATDEVAAGTDLHPTGTLHIYPPEGRVDQTGAVAIAAIADYTFDPDTGAGLPLKTARTGTAVFAAPKTGGMTIKDANGYAFLGVSPESKAAAYEHLEWGHWGDMDAGFASSEYAAFAPTAVWVAGEKTPDAFDFATLGTATADYAGEMAGGFLSSTVTDPAVVLRGSFSMNANLSAKTFTGSFDLTDKVSGASFLSGGTFTSGSWSSNGNVSATMDGTTAGGSTATGSFGGAFFGPQAEEIGGAWHITASGGSDVGDALGILAGKRQ